MGRISIFLLWAVPAMAQLAPPGGERSFFNVAAPPAGPKLQFNAAVEPPLVNPAELKLGWGVFYVQEHGHDVWHRFVYDTVHQQYFGYDLIVDPPQVNLLTNQPRVRDQYRVTFAPLSIQPDEMQPKGLSLVALPKYPDPQTLMPGDVIGVELLVSVDGKRSVVDHVQIAPLDGMPSSQRRIAYFKADNQSPRTVYERLGRVAGINVAFDGASLSRLGDPSQKVSFELADVTPDEALNLIAIATHTFWKPTFGNSTLVMQEVPRPTSTGDPKDYTLDDGPLKFDFMGEVLISGQKFQGLTWFLVFHREGATPWFYFPGKGRFVLSLVPHEGFTKAGEIRDNAIRFRWDGQEYQVTMNSPIVETGGVWNLFVRHDERYELDSTVIADLPSGLAGSGAPMVIGGIDRLEKLSSK